jgi:lipopolysaccharide/colanic/teichoic acid biosynthesis glycosyltransferase
MYRSDAAEGLGGAGEAAVEVKKPLPVPVPRGRPYDLVKRATDIVVASLAMLVFLIPILLLTWLVRSKLGSPVFFRQVRPGVGGKPFEMVKFRTMTDERDEHGELLPDAERLTSFGKFLRSSSLDELPELWNVLKGDMSLVGPRPLLMEYLPKYTRKQARRHEVRPGITGWAQINGRNRAKWTERLRNDVWYVDNRSFLLDLRILWGTVRYVLARKDISEAGEATMSKFNGAAE